MDYGDPNKPDAASELTDHDWTKDVEVGNRQGMRVEISNAMVGLKKSFYGRGPTKAKTYINDNYVLCVLEGGLTKNEQTLLAAGEARLVRQYRLRFQEVMADATTEAVELPRQMETQIEVRPLWSTWVCFGLVVMLLMGEWLIRKIVTLP